MENKLIYIDCMEYMKDIPDNHFDLGIVDVNYGIGQGGGNNHTRSKLSLAKNYKDYGDSKSPDKEYFDELLRISKNQIIWGANHFISKIPYDSPCWIIWDKHTTGDFADCELAYTSFKTAVKKFDYPWNGMIQGFHGTKSKNEMRIHPNQKPVALYKWLLTNYAEPGYKIIDTHSGSGSLRVAAYDLGFDLVSCENHPDYYTSNKDRYQQHIHQDLFKPEERQKSTYKQKELL